MSLQRPNLTTVFAPWSLRLVSLAAQLLAATAVLHRFAALQTAVAMNLMAVAFVAAGIAALGGVAALMQIWRHGSPGTSSATGAVLIGGALLLVPAYYVPIVMHGSNAFDASTDTAQPPAYEALARVRQSAGLDPGVKPVGRAAPDITLEPVVTGRSPGDVFDLANDLMRQLDLNVVAEQAPGFGEADGTIEATDRTLVLGLTDDVVIRIGIRGSQTRVDVRSAARYPRLDLGRNAERVQLVVRKLRAAIDASVPSDPALAGDAPEQTTATVAAKPAAGTAGATTVLRRKKRGPFQPGAQGGPAQTIVPH